MRSMEKRPLAQPRAMVSGKAWRFTVLTPALIRVEYDAEGSFNDAPTQTVLYRDFPVCAFTAEKQGEGVTIETDKLTLSYLGGAFTSESLTVTLKENGSVCRFGERPAHPLGGTVRTLDVVNGACCLGSGLFSREGWEVLDDSAALLLDEKDWPQPRKDGVVDQYLFCYGQDYLTGLRDFFRLTGEMPMLPRFTMGNWWSRYYPYTQAQYLALMDRFHKENVPMSVAVIDMDWHLTKIDPKYGGGWTGYTWNSELFPDHVAFLKNLHDRGMKATLNLHPADGIRAYEKAYPALAEHMGVDAAAEEPVPFDPASPKFMHYYFEDVLHPMEEEGVDFWWLDWQQGQKTGMKGLDPLWMLNHFHFMDSARNGLRPLTFSRYAGPGSHRYPVGFSGDTYVTWESLNFQPYFTATADNIGYAWWSHDIGGHMHGVKDDELYGRWVQWGAFAPICRLHSSINEFNVREPWRYRADVRDMAEDFLRLRHRMIPYLYTMNHRAWAEGLPLCQPMYYGHPKEDAAYNVPNEYTFGSELICAPITSHTAADAPVASTTVWLPEGTWTDFFTGVTYQGGQAVEMYRTLYSFPVLAKAGAIIPMDDDPFAAAQENPKALTLRVYPGASNTFTLYEDDNKTEAYQQGVCAKTHITYTEGDVPTLTVAAEGDLSLLPSERRWTVELANVLPVPVCCQADGQAVEAASSYDEEKHLLRIELPVCPVGAKLTLTFPEGLQRDDRAPLDAAYWLINDAEIPLDDKQRVYDAMTQSDGLKDGLLAIQTRVSSRALAGALMELCRAYWEQKQRS